MLTTGRLSSYSNPADDKSADSFTCPHEHTISGPDVHSHTGTHSKSDDFPLCHPFPYTNFGAVGNGYIHPNGRTDSYELAYAVSRTYGHTDRDRFTIADISSNRHERPNGDIHADDNRHTVADACPHHHADSHKLAYPDTSTHSRPDRHTFTHTHSDRDAHTEFFRTR